VTFRLYPIGEDEFGRKGGMLKLTFGDGCLTMGGHTCKKSKHHIGGSGSVKKARGIYDV
jgi:hypothetical protein